VGVAIGLLEAAAAGAAANVRINLDGIQDETFRSRTLGELEQLEATMADSVRIARTALSG
jgi:formiminotetrahydrofolate cyclodeaminase